MALVLIIDREVLRIYTELNDIGLQLSNLVFYRKLMTVDKQTWI